MRPLVPEVSWEVSTLTQGQLDLILCSEVHIVSNFTIKNSMQRVQDQDLDLSISVFEQ